MLVPTSSCRPLPKRYTPRARPPALGAFAAEHAAVAGDPNKPGERGDEDVATERRVRTDKPRRFKVILHNDNYTTMEFVVDVLMKFFHKNETEATHIMLAVHHRGHGVAGIYSRDVAETKVAQVTRYARDQGMPLKTTAEPE
jgi:ATP-dependent Clp protease adaptor protein ClpS